MKILCDQCVNDCLMIPGCPNNRVKQKRQRIATKPLKGLLPGQTFRYIGSDDNDWLTVTSNSLGVCRYNAPGGYPQENNKIDGIRIIVKP